MTERPNDTSTSGETPSAPEPDQDDRSDQDSRDDEQGSKSKKGTVIRLIVLVVVIALIVYGFWKAAQPAPLYFQGQMDAQEADIAPKISARINRVLVSEGQAIQAGDLLIEMDSPEVRAKMTQAIAARDAAQAQADKAANGARPEEVEMARRQWMQAQSAAEFAEVSYRRVENLFAQGLVAAQRRDEAATNFKASVDQALAAKAQYDMAVAGARHEDQAAAQAQARQGEGLLEEARAAEDETRLRSPVGGEITKVLANEGELSPQGVAVVTVVDLTDQWVVLNIREEDLHHFAQGASFSATIPALANRVERFTVYYQAVLPDFATWRATRASQGFDVRTFEVRARPEKPIEGARPGMSVVVDGDL